MPDKTVWELHDPEDKSKPGAVARSMEPQKNPALAFSLSLLFGGSGQIYNQQWQLGLLFTFLMANFYMGLYLLIAYWEFITTSLKAVHISPSGVFLGGAIYYLSGLIFWTFNALHAYNRANETRIDPFQGIKNPLLPPLCSVLVPGWGQFLNGQPKKGGFYLIFALAGLLVIPVLIFIPLLWPTLESTIDRLALERILAIALFLFPLVLLMWLLSIYDALKVCLNPFKKGPLRKRIIYAINRVRINGWVIPRAKLTLMLGLFLVLSLTLCYYYLPQKYYTHMLQTLQVRLSQENMVLIPHFIHQFLQVISPEERHP